MKKILILLMIMSSLCFASWKEIDEVNDFNEKTGNKEALYKLEHGSFLKFSKGIEVDKNFEIIKGSSIPILELYSSEYVGNNKKYTFINLKVDDNKVFYVMFYTKNDGKSLVFFKRHDIGNELPLIINQMKKGKILKIVINKEDGIKVLKTINLKGFTRVYNKLKI